MICRHEAGSLTGEAGIAPGTILSIDGKVQKGAPNTPIIGLACPTFAATAAMAGVSRILGGYHIAADNVEGLALGRKVADYSWPKYRAYFEGTARPGVK